MFAAADVSDHVVEVQHSTVRLFPPIVQSVYGNGMCINKNCSLVATAYHIQMLAGRANLEVAKERTEKILSLGSETDPNRSDVPLAKSGRVLRLDVANDISFIYTKKPVPHKSSASYSYRYCVGQKVTVAGYNHHKFETREARIIGSNMLLVIGQTQLRDNLILDIALEPGTSGSAVLDENGNLLGMIVLTGAVKVGVNNLTVSVALPTRTIAKALTKLDPGRGFAIFNNIPEDEAKPEQTPELVHQESDLPEDTSPLMPSLSALPSAVPDSVGKLRARSEVASRLMVNYIAKQCFVRGTQKPVCHELSVVDGQQAFREIDRNGKLGKGMNVDSIKSHGAWKRASWYEVIGEIADNPWVFEGAQDDHYLFTHNSTVADDRCYYEEYSHEVPLFGGRHSDWKGAVPCFELVITDKTFNIVSTFTEMYPPEECLAQLYQSAIYYDWVKLAGLDAPVWLPVKERTTTKYLGHKELVYTSMSWTDYTKFRAEHRIVAGKQ